MQKIEQVSNCPGPPRQRGFGAPRDLWPCSRAWASPFLSRHGGWRRDEIGLRLDRGAERLADEAALLCLPENLPRRPMCAHPLAGAAANCRCRVSSARPTMRINSCSLRGSMPCAC